MISNPIFSNNRSIGLLGGSFNPAHTGHLHITLHALKTLGLDEVWWLVSPHNPLKSEASLADYRKRLQSAREIAVHHPRIRVLDIEARAGLQYTWQTVAFLKKHHPAAHFVWLMGADNLAQFHRWQRWQRLMRSVPIAVFDRAPFSHTSLRSKTYSRFRKFLLKNNELIKYAPAPALQFIHLRRDPLSATSLRKKLGKGAFLAHTKK